MRTETSSKFNSGISLFKAAAGQKRYFFLVMAVIFATYFVAETRFMSLNFDDTYLLGGHFPAWENLPFFGSGGYALFWQYDMTQNQFRTYGLSRIVHFLLFRIVGTDMRYYYWIMALMACTTAWFAAKTTRTVTNSQSASLAVTFCFLLGPFALFQTFHHATYLLLPLMVMSAYLFLNAKNPTGIKRRIAGGLMCAIITMTGDVATSILLAAISFMAVHALKSGDRYKLQCLLTEFLIVITILGGLYGYYRLIVYNPDLTSRFELEATPSIHTIIDAVYGFNKKVLGMIVGKGAINVIRDDNLRIDYFIVISIIASVFATTLAIVRSSETGRRKPWNSVLFLILLYISSFIVYVALAAFSGVSNYPYRYVQTSGFILLGTFCLSSVLMPSRSQKLILILLVWLSAAGGILTYGIKVPTVESASDLLNAKIAMAKAHGGARVKFIAPENAGGFINPYYLQPATTPLSEWWILQHYSQIVWGLPCGHGISGEPGDIVVTAIPTREGFMPSFKVDLIKE